MKIGALFSGGKDSCLAIYKAQKFHEVTCLISLIPESEESRVFHFPNIWVTKFQAECMGLPIVHMKTSDEERRALNDLSRALKLAVRMFGIEGIVTGIIKSTYQASRVQMICDKLNLWCFNPLWLKDPKDLLSEILERNFKVIISGVFAYPLDKSLLGRTIDASLLKDLFEFHEKYGINIAGEGGEIETTVLDAPMFRKRLEVTDYEIQYKDNSGIFRIKDLRLINK